MPGRGPTVAPGVRVWSRLADVLSYHPQLKEQFYRYFPRGGHVGKYIEGVVKSSAALLTINQQPVWDVHYAGVDSTVTMKRRHFETALPAVHKVAIINHINITLQRDAHVQGM